MKKFAQVLNSKLHWKFEQDKAPEFASDIEIIEITDIETEPQEGWGWDGKAFIKPAAPDPKLVIAASKANAIYRIEALELKCLRPLREGDTKRIAEIDTKIKALRDEIKVLDSAK